MIKPQGPDGLLESLLDLLACGVAVLDAEDRIRSWNDAAGSILGWRPDDAVGQNAVELAIPASQWPVARCGLDRLRREGYWKGNLLLRRAAGETVLCAVRTRVLPDEDGGAPGRLLVVFVDLADQRLVDDERTNLLRAERAARSELERVRDRLAFVVHASSRLASSLDVGMTLETAGDLVVPRFGQVCAIDLWDGRRLDRVFVKDSKPDLQPTTDRTLAADLEKLSGKQRDDHPAMRSIRTGRPTVIAETDDELAAQMYDEPELREIVLRATDRRGFVTVPLITRGRVIGVLTVLGASQGPGSELSAGEDLAVLEQVATRAAQSIENARLFDAERRLARNLQDSERRQRQAALTLQRSLLPPWTHQPEELELATRYFPGTADAEVGGDWYDVIPVAPGRTALVIGDVMGRGLRAATLMGQVRTAVRAYARQDIAPKEMLELLDGVVADLGEAEIVTGVYAVFDAARGTLTYASAGHLPLLIVDRNGKARRLDHESGLPLGVGSCAAPEHVVEISAGSLVVFYTDGLVEHRERDVDAGIDELVAALAGASGSLEGLCDTVVEALRPPGGYDDDVGLLMARSRTARETKSGSGVSVTVPHDLSAAPFARSKIEQALRQWGIDGELFDNIVLTTSELIANALQHGAPPVQLQLRRLPGTIVVEASDGSSAPPKPGNPAPTDYDGRRRGLQLVKLLSDRWGWRRTQRGKTVWCEHVLDDR